MNSGNCLVVRIFFVLTTIIILPTRVQFSVLGVDEDEALMRLRRPERASRLVVFDRVTSDTFHEARAEMASCVLQVL